MAKVNAGEQQSGGGATRTARKQASAPKADGQGAADGASTPAAGAPKSPAKSAPAARTGAANGAAADTASPAPGKTGATKSAGPAKSGAVKSAGPAKAGAEKTAAPAKVGAVKSASPAKSPAKTASSAPAKSAGGARGKGKKPDLRADLRDFVSARPGGWGHEDWTSFLDHLSSKGHDTSNPDDIGMQLERERLADRLERAGVPTAQGRKLVEQFGTLWSLRHADADELESAGLTRSQMDELARG